jgi:dihydroceramide fatty acyl 2-hydroxylase
MEAPRTDDAARASRTDSLRASPRMFDNEVLDRLSRVHPIVPPLIFGPVIVLMATLAFEGLSPLRALLAIIGGYLFWTLTEYGIHRFVFHFEPDHPVGARFHWIIHGVHHDHPNDPMRLVMPPSVSVPLAALFVLGFYLVLGSPSCWGVGAGFLVGYLAYDMLHYALHHFRPRGRVGKRLRELHMRHHFQDDDRGFGISAPWWDVVFRTFPHRRGTPRQ